MMHAENLKDKLW